MNPGSRLGKGLSLDFDSASFLEIVDQLPELVSRERFRSGACWAAWRMRLSEDMTVNVLGLVCCAISAARSRRVGIFVAEGEENTQSSIFCIESEVAGVKSEASGRGNCRLPGTIRAQCGRESSSRKRRARAAKPLAS